MALVFGAATSDRVDYGDPSSIQNLDPFTAVVWVYITTATSGRILFAKRPSATAGKQLLLTGASKLLEGDVQRATTSSFSTMSTALPLNTWTMIVMVFNSSTGVKLYTATLDTAPAEVTYGSQQVGAGAVSSDVGNSLMVGNRIGTANAFQGSIAHFSLWAQEFALGDILRFWQQRVPDANCRVFTELGFAAPTGTQPDWSGHGLSGTLTGATVGAHVPTVPLLGGRPTLGIRSPQALSATLSGSMTPAGALVRSSARTLVATLTPAGVLIRAASRALTATLTPGAGALSRSMARLVAGSVTPGPGAVVRSVARALGGTVTPAGTVGRSTMRALAGTLTSSGTLVRGASRVLAGSLTPAGDLTGAPSTGGQSMTLAGSLTPSGALTRTVSRALSGVLTSSGALVRVATHQMSGGLTPAGALVRNVARAFTASLAMSGALTWTVTPGTAPPPSVMPGYNVPVTDGMRWTVAVRDGARWSIPVVDAPRWSLAIRKL